MLYNNSVKVSGDLMKSVLPLFTLFLLCTFASAETHLTPLDFGLKLMDHGMVDYVHTPPDIRVGLFNNDRYPDIARFKGNKLDVFLFQGVGYTPEPQLSRTFDLPIQCLRLDDDIWDGIDDLVVTLADGRRETLYHLGDCLDLEGSGDTFKRSDIPRRVSEADFQIVWESEPKPWEMDRCAVGDLDNDGTDEVVSWWMENANADTAWILIYKSVGDNLYEVYMEEMLYHIEPTPGLSEIVIGDIDGNGQKELIYSYQYCYIWEFTENLDYTIWRANFEFPSMVKDLKITDIDQDGVSEIASVASHTLFPPPTAYNVWEYDHKTTGPENIIYFNPVITIYLDRYDCEFDVGDFDNDGREDIVCGNFGFVVSYIPIDLPYYSYVQSYPHYQENWLETGLPLSCATPVIGDFDGDGGNELFAGGLYPNGSSAFIWKPTGFQSGYVMGLDTTLSPAAPNEAVIGVVDDLPCVISVHIIPVIPTASSLLLWSCLESVLSNLWQSGIDDSASYHNPYCVDPDNDGKKSIIIAAGGCHQLKDWEQISAGIIEPPEIFQPKAVTLYQNYPNPFNSETRITFDVSRRTDVVLSILNPQGMLVQKWIKPELLPARYVEIWKAENLASGCYFIQLETLISADSKKCLLIK